jgi:hypothetical protein
MRNAIVIMLGLTALSQPGHAQPSPTLQLPEIVIGGDKRPGNTPETCADAPASGGGTYKCLNEKLQKQVDRVNPRMNIPPTDARSTDLKIGLVNTSAVRQQYGSNYGVSVVPFRPPLPTYSSALGRR